VVADDAVVDVLGTVGGGGLSNRGKHLAMLGGRARLLGQTHLAISPPSASG
jgi:hypothetical protein